MYILDTSITSLHQRRHPRVVANMAIHAMTRIVISTVTIEEAWSGCLSAIRRTQSNQQLALQYSLLARVVNDLSNFPVLAPSVSALDRYDSLVKQRLNIGSNDLRIAAMALDVNATVVTVNVRDFSRVPGLKWVDWSQ